MDLTLSLASESVDPSDLHALALDMISTLNAETEGSADLRESAGGPGAKGDEIAVASLLYTFLSGGAAVALLNVVKAYVDRERSLSVDLEREDGRKISLEAKNLQTDQIDYTRAMIREFLGE